MATIPVIIGFGNSVWDGYANLSDVTTAQMVRWVGADIPTTAFPYDESAPGVRMFTPRLPYATSSVILGDGTGVATATLDSIAPGTNDKWVYILGPAGGIGQGQHRRITAGGGTVNITVAPNWTAIPSARSSFEVLGSSHTAAGGGTPTTVIKTATTTAFAASDVGRWLVGLSGANAGSARKITALLGATSVSCESFANAFAANDGMRVLDGPNSVETNAQITSTRSALRDFRFYYDFANSYSTGFEYPNIKSSPVASPSAHKNAQLINMLPELLWQFRSQFNVKPVCVSLGISACTLAPAYFGTQLAESGAFSWGHDITHLDFHPASPNGLYQALTDMVTAACTLITAEGNTPDVLAIMGTIAENDAADEKKANAFKSNLTLFRDSIRKFCSDNNYTKRKPHEIPFIVSNLKSSVNTYAIVTNQAMADMATEDSRTAVVDTSDATYSSGPHFDTKFSILAATRFFDKWKTIFDADNYASRSTTDLPTLSKLRTQVRRRFERSAQSNDHPDQQIDQFLNDALREIYNTLGDMAWFLRRAMPATIESGVYPATISLDGHVTRLCRIESASNPGLALVWKGISYTTNLRTQITLHDVADGGPYIVHFIQLPREMTDANDVAIIPSQYLELVVILACKRLAECVANAGLSNYYAAETERLWKYVRRDCLRQERIRQEQMVTTNAYNSLTNGTAPSPLWYL